MDRLELYIYDYIGPWEPISAQSVVDQLREHAMVSSIDVYVNSRGGDCWEGISIYNALVRHRANVRVSVDGLAASIASVIVQAGDQRLIADGAQMMIHDPSGGGWGDIGDLESAIQELEHARDSIATIYAQRSGTDSPQAYLDLMRAETWFSSAEAVAAGLADAVVPAKAPSAVPPLARLAASREPVYRIQKPTKSGLVPVLRAMPTLNKLPQTIGTMSKPDVIETKPSFMDRIRNAFSLDESATEDDILETVERAGAPEPAVPEPEPAPEPDSPVLAAVNKLSSRLETIEQRLGAQEQARHEQVVDAAIAALRIPAAERDEWLEDFRKDSPTAQARLDKRQPGAASPSSLKPAPPSAQTLGEPIRISREAARNDTKAYDRARAEAREKGVSLQLVD